MSDLVGHTLGKYQLVDRLGRGGMADVYKAYQPGLDRYVAIKVLHPHLAEEENFVSRFQREAQSVSTLSHPHIVQVFDFDMQNDTYYMVMAYVEGGRTLKELLKDLGQNGQRISIEKALDITAAVADALAYAHRRGMIHRDVKPANILIKDDTYPILSDFGIAHIVDSTTLTRTGATVGTPTYMAPEQGAGGQVTERTDIYALGVTLYEMLTGRPPYEADTPYAVILKHISDPIVPPHMIVPVPSIVEPVVLKAMSKRPEYRYATADAMARAARDALEGARNGAEMETQFVNTQIEAFEGFPGRDSRAGVRPTDDITTHELDADILNMPYGAIGQARTKTGITQTHEEARTRPEVGSPKPGGFGKIAAVGGLLVIVLALAGFLVMGGKKSIPAAPPGTIYAAEIDGTVHMTLPGQPVRQLKSGDTVTVGAGDPRIRLEVADESKAIISLEDGSVIYIGPTTTIGLDSLINAARHSTGTILSLHGGRLLVKVAPLQGNTFGITTPVGTRGEVLGSLMGAQYIDVLEQFDIDCLEGHCRQYGGPGISPLSLEDCQHALVVSVGAPEGPDRAHSDLWRPLFGDVVPDCAAATLAATPILPPGPTPTRVPIVPTFTPQFNSTESPAGGSSGPAGTSPAGNSTSAHAPTATTNPLVSTLVAVPTQLPTSIVSIPTSLPDLPITTLVPIVPTLIPDLPVPTVNIPDLPIPTVNIPIPTVKPPVIPTIKVPLLP